MTFSTTRSERECGFTWFRVVILTGIRLEKAAGYRPHGMYGELLLSTEYSCYVGRTPTE